MFIRSLNDVESTDRFVDWGNGTSHRLLTQQDGVGFTVCTPWFARVQNPSCIIEITLRRVTALRVMGKSRT